MKSYSLRNIKEFIWKNIVICNYFMDTNQLQTRTVTIVLRLLDIKMLTNTFKTLIIHLTFTNFLKNIHRHVKHNNICIHIESNSRVLNRHTEHIHRLIKH